MPKLNKKDAADVIKVEGYEGHFGELDDYTVAFESYTADADMSDMFKGLPDDRCQCPHWGVVLKGKLKFSDAEGDTIIEAGEAYYMAPGHLPYLYAGSEVVEFSPTKLLQDTLAVVEKNMAQSA
ncbi:MAG: cupin domain-containing protein [Acidimicrobiia bacterium]|nr:cupin domain-containing protein [Acidimicrobiia bacterium]